MILAIFGYPKTGKTLFFNILTNQREKVSKFSLAGDELHKAVVQVPDDRVTRLAEFCEGPPVYARIEFLDTGAVAFGEAKETTFLDLLRRSDGLVHLVRGFEDMEILHSQGQIDPERDIRSMESELTTTDFLSVEKRLERLALDNKKMKSKEIEEEIALFQRLRQFLEQGGSLREFPFSASEEPKIRGYKFLSQKPIFHLINCDEKSWQQYRPLALRPERGRSIAVFAGKIEQELLDLDPSEREIFQKEFGLDDYRYIRDEFIRTSYELLNLISFFTVGKDETKAWTVEKGTDAYHGAEKIHSDIQRGFIRAEVVRWDDFLQVGGFVPAKEKGMLRLEGKEYIIHDGDIVHFRFNS